jgi:hypothetical protein
VIVGSVVRQWLHATPADRAVEGKVSLHHRAQEWRGGSRRQAVGSVCALCRQAVGSVCALCRCVWRGGRCTSWLAPKGSPGQVPERTTPGDSGRRPPRGRQANSRSCTAISRPECRELSGDLPRGVLVRVIATQGRFGLVTQSPAGTLGWRVLWPCGSR